MVKEYWRTVHRQAFAESAQLLGLDSRMRIMIGAIVVVVILGCLAFWGSADASRDEAIVRLAIAGTVIGLFPFVYLWKLVQIPARLHTEGVSRGHQPTTNEFELGRVESKIDILDPGENLGGQQQYFRLWCPIKFKRKVDSVSVRVRVLRPLQPLDRLAPQYIWKPVESKTFYEGDTVDVVFATVARDRNHNGFYGDMRKDAFYIGRISRHLFEIDVLIDTRRATKRIYLESTPGELYSDAPRGFGQFGNLFFVLEEGDNFFESEWIRLSREAVAGNLSLPLGTHSKIPERGFLGLGK